MTELTPEQKMKLFIQDRPWEDEPNEAEWVDDVTGYKCRIWRHPTHQTLNGYVGIPRAHPCAGMDYDDLNDLVDVHGGLTYAEWDKATGYKWFGFDTNHGGDFSPHMYMTLLGVDRDPDWYKNETYRDWAYVDAQVRGLAKQLEDLDKEFK